MQKQELWRFGVRNSIHGPFWCVRQFNVGAKKARDSARGGGRFTRALFDCCKIRRADENHHTESFIRSS
jgi:hypothetical protein